ncbi:hypothetical protein [Salsuginibacillus kocurii]|uniref:hypothetical protein n=1 Tax=Salsuginibacillus kocurii TaxID=427078 RepID=UPI00037048E9|nr:hypothetical protein [Salsuginibacillus kocurii]
MMLFILVWAVIVTGLLLIMVGLKPVRNKQPKLRFVLNTAFTLQILWLILFFTDGLGVLGTWNTVVQEIYWIGTASIGILVALIALLYRNSKLLAFNTFLLSSFIFALWYMLTRLTQM